MDGTDPAARTTQAPAAVVPVVRHAFAVTRSVLLALKNEVFSDHLRMVASGLAFYAMLAVLPMLAGIAAVWALFGSPEILDRALGSAGFFLPSETIELSREFVTSVPETYGLGVGLAVNLVIVLWTAWRSANGLITALNIVFDAEESRGRIQRAFTALGIAFGGSGFLLMALIVLALPALLATPQSPVTLIRWPILAATFFVGLGLLYRFGPCRRDPRWKPLSWGAFVGTALWLIASVGLSSYLANAATFGRLYGSVGSVILALIWFYISALAVLTGAELDAILQKQKDGSCGRAPEAKGVAKRAVPGS